MAKFRGTLDAGLIVRGVKSLLFEIASRNNLDINIQSEGFFVKTYLFVVEGDWDGIERFKRQMKYSIDEYNN